MHFQSFYNIKRIIKNKETIDLYQKNEGKYKESKTRQEIRMI